MFYAKLVDIRSNNLQGRLCFIHLLTSLYKRKKNKVRKKRPINPKTMLKMHNAHKKNRNLKVKFRY